MVSILCLNDRPSKQTFANSFDMGLQPAEGDDSALHQALVESEAEERHRQDEQSARERADFALALAASRRSPTPPASTSTSAVYDLPTPTSSRPHSPPVPAFSDADLARSAYYPNEKSVQHPQGRPALPPGAGGAWDDEMREMEMLALAIRISQEEEEERKRIEELQLREALRESERQVQQLEDDVAAASNGGADSASATSSLAPRITPGSPPSSDGSFERPSRPPPLEHASPRTRRSSWIQPPLASSMARQGSNTSADGSAEASAAHPPPPRPPRPTLPQLDASGRSSASTATSSQTGPETPSATSPPRTSNWQASPPKPKRAPPPPPGGAHTSAATSLSPLPRFESTSADELWRKANDGSPLEMPNLTPSSSIRGHHQAGTTLNTIEGAHAPAGSPKLSEQLVRRISQASSGSYATALSAPLDDDDDDETDSTPAPFSPLSIRNPDLRAPTPSDGSRSSTLSSTTSAGSDPASQEPHWAGGDGSGFPMGAMAISAYAGRSMSAISELTEPVSSAAATEDGASERTGRADSFPSTVSIDTESRYESSPHDGEISERNWIAGRWNGDDVAATPRPPRTASPSLLTPPHAPEATGTSSSSITHTPPTTSADHSGPSSTIRPRTEPQQVQVTTALAQDDGLRCGYPAECARELDHVCPADGLSASAGIPETVELASDLPPNHTSWAIEAHSWVALVRALMWYGDTVVTASPDDLADSPSTRCAATASLEFRSDDEDVPILRLVLALLPPRDPASHQAVHRELCVQKSQSGNGAKGKGKARARPAPSSSFLLPDVVHLPARLSSLAIQLYSLRHLASIARATQPSTPLPLQARGNGTVEGYPALRELADAITTLAQAAQGRRHGASQPNMVAPRPSEQAGTSELAQQPAPDQTERLLDRLRARLRGLKRHRNAEGAVVSSEDEDAFATSGAAERNPPSANKLVKPRRRSSSQPPDRSGKAPESEPRAPADLFETSDVGEPSHHGGARGDMRYLPTLSAS